jgi:hypothetical protein
VSAFVYEAEHRAARRYSMEVVSYAHELAEAGWKPLQICAAIGARYGLDVTPAVNTVRSWVEPGFIRTRRRSAVPAQRRWRQRQKASA